MFWSWAWVSVGVPGFERTVAADVLYPSAAPFTWFGWVGVEIFFVISGFVIANSATQSSPGAFRLGRVLRLMSLGCCRDLLLCLVLLDVDPSHLGSISFRADHGLGGRGAPHCHCSE